MAETEKFRDLTQPPIDVPLLDDAAAALSALSFTTGFEKEELQDVIERWQRFIPDLVVAAKTNETTCENCMAILKLLSEEVFGFSRGEMTQQQIIEELKQPLNSEFQLIHELCLYVLSTSQKPELIRATLATMHAFLSWIPLASIFDSPLIETLLGFFHMPSYRNLTLQCLTEIATLNFGDLYNLQYVNMYNVFILQLQNVLPSGAYIIGAYANGSSEEQAFIQNVALFLTAFYKFHIRVLESKQENIATLMMGLEYLINISYVDDTEIFKVCLDYWNSLVLELYKARHNLEIPAATANMRELQIYASLISKLRLLMISRMARPQTVPVFQHEKGRIVRHTVKEKDLLIRYKIMRETHTYLLFLDHDDTEKQMLKKLSELLNGEDWTWNNNLNKLCWAIGSISGLMKKEQEERFLVLVIRGLLDLCKITKGKTDKVVIASNIMYIVGQYPRFQDYHKKYLSIATKELSVMLRETLPQIEALFWHYIRSLSSVNKCRGD